MKLKTKRNTNPEFVREFSKSLKENEGYCPCKLDKSPDTKCPCEEFRKQDVPGWCHCGLYEKVEEE